jgi:hypothetical protein
MTFAANILVLWLCASPAAPSGFSATAVAPDRISVSWLDNSRNETGFRLQWLNDSTWEDVLTTNGGLTGPGVTTVSVGGLDNANSYWFRVRAENVGGYSAWPGRN